MLKLVLAIDGPTVPQWQFTLLELIVGDPRFEVGILIDTANCISSRYSRQRARSGWDTIDRVERSLSYVALGRRRYRANPDLHRKITDLGKEWAMLRAKAWRGLGSRRVWLDQASMAIVEHYAPDVIVALQGQRMQPDLQRVARYGSWFFEHLTAHHDLLGFREILEDNPVTTVRVLSECGGSAVEARCTGVYKTYPLSWNENRRRARVKSLWLMLDALGRLSIGGQQQTDAISRCKPYRYSHTPLTAIDGLAAASVQTCRAVRRGVRQIFLRDQWQVLVAGQSASEGQDMIHFIPPSDRFWADPFVASEQGSSYVFVEEYRYSESRGTIVCLPVSPTPGINPVPVLNLPYHLSYPFLFRHDGRLFMIPESRENLSIDLWMCSRFPDVWTKAKTLMEGVSAADSSLVEHDGRWWMFTNIDRAGLDDHTAELHIFSSPDPVAGRWVPHPANPVVVDCRRARMGGGVIRTRDGRLIRIGQYTSREYGEALVLCDVKVLTPDLYEEAIIRTVKPGLIDAAFGAHHSSATDDFIARDELTRRQAWSPRSRGSIRRLPCPAGLSFG